MNPLKIIKNGIIDENPTFSQVIGMCPTLAVTTSFMNGLGMGFTWYVYTSYRCKLYHPWSCRSICFKEQPYRFFI